MYMSPLFVLGALRVSALVALKREDKGIVEAVTQAMLPAAGMASDRIRATRREEGLVVVVVPVPALDPFEDAIDV
jgi:hypothetical protein